MVVDPIHHGYDFQHQLLSCVGVSSTRDFNSLGLFFLEGGSLLFVFSSPSAASSFSGFFQGVEQGGRLVSLTGSHTVSENQN